MGIDIDTRDSFLSDHFGFLNDNDDTAEINAEGQITNEINEPECTDDVTSGGVNVSNVIQFNDKWSRDTFKFQPNSVEKIDNILLSDLIYTTNWNNKEENSKNYQKPQINYDDERGILTFTDDTISKVDPFGCVLAGTENINLIDMVRDLEVLDEFNRVTDFGAIYDFQVKRLTYGTYQYANAQVCSDLSKYLGYFSLDKIINDEVVRQKRAELNGDEYQGVLNDPTYIEHGWINIDHLIHASLEDEWGYDNEWSLSIRTRRFKSRKKALVFLLLNYSSNIWGLNSRNKLVDFGVRIVDRTTGKQLDYTAFSNGLNSEHGSTGLAQFVGTLEEAPRDDNNDLSSGQPVGDEACKNFCDKVYTDKCSGRVFKLACPQLIDTEEENATYHELSPQFKINHVKNVREEKKDIVNTIDAIHWTTGIQTLEKIAEDGNISIEFIEDLKREFGRTPFLSSYLNEDRAFHSAGGTFEDGFAASGYHNGNESDGTLSSGYRNTTESWNGTTWSLIDRTAPKICLGISGGDSSFAAAGWGGFGDIFSFNSTASIYVFKPTSGWSLSDVNTIVRKHSTAGVFNVNNLSKGQEDFNEVFISKFEKPVQGCVEDNTLLKTFLGEFEESDVAVLNNFSGICFNGTRSGLSLDYPLCSDFDDTFIYFSSHKSEKYNTNTRETDVLETACSFVEPTKKYPIKTIGTKYVGSGIAGIATGGKTCDSTTDCYSAKIRMCKANLNVDDSETATIRRVYEFNNTTWIRRDDMPEGVAFHTGVGNQDHAIFWGGLHSTIELARMETSIPGCDKWNDIISSFQGDFDSNGICSFNNHIRYSEFATENLIYTNELYEAVKTDDEEINNGGQLKQTAIPNEDGFTIDIWYYTGGSTGRGSPIKVGVENAHLEGFCNYPEQGFSQWIPDASASNEDYAINRTNFEISFVKGFESHPTTGGMWLWSRPHRGEVLFHNENIKTDSVLPHDKFFIGKDKQGLEQEWYSDIRNRYIDRWTNPYSMYMEGVNDSYVQWGDETVTLGDLSETGSISVGQFTVSNISGNASEIIEDVVRNQFNVDSVALSGINEFMSWYESEVPELSASNFRVKAYDDSDYFNDSELISQNSDIVGSSVRDRAGLFPWNELLQGRADSKAVQGTITWRWASDGLYVAETIFANYVSLENSETFIDSLGRVQNVEEAVSSGYYSTVFWREKHRITKYDIRSNPVFFYDIVYDDVKGFPIESEYHEATTSVFGNSILPMNVDETIISKTNIHKKEYDTSYPNHLETMSVNWTQETRNVLLENYNYKFRTLCDILQYGYNSSKPEEGVLLLGKTGEKPNISVWPWTVPYNQTGNKNFIKNSETYIQPSSIVTPLSNGCEIVRKIEKYENGVRLSRAVMASPSSNGIGLYNIGKSNGYGSKPFDYGGVKRFIENEIPSDNDILESFPWIALGESGLVGPTGMVEMIDEDGNYWIAIGDSDNLNPSQHSTEDFINTYTIMMIPESKIDEFKKLVLAPDNYEDCILQTSDFDKKDWSGESVSRRERTYVSTRGSRNREGFLELVNSRVGERFFDLYIKIFDYNLTKAESHPYVEIEFNNPTEVENPPYILPFEVDVNNSIYPINKFDLVSPNDATCACNFCDIEGVVNFEPTMWKQHNHDEWVSSNLESPFSGPFSRDGFNVWLTAGQDPRWGSVLWSTVDEGKGWMTFRQSRIGIDKEHGNITTIIVTASFNMKDFSGSNGEIPLYFTYDEFIFNLEDYSSLKEVQRLIELDDDIICDDTLLTYVNPNILIDCSEESTVDIDIWKSFMTEDVSAGDAGIGDQIIIPQEFIDAGVGFHSQSPYIIGPYAVDTEVYAGPGINITGVLTVVEVSVENYIPVYPFLTEIDPETGDILVQKVLETPTVSEGDLLFTAYNRSKYYIFLGRTTGSTSDLMPMSINGIITTIPKEVIIELDPEPDAGYTEWTTCFIMEYKKRKFNEDGSSEKYYYRYNVEDSESNTYIPREGIRNDNKDLILTDWRRFQDGVGLGGDTPIINNRNFNEASCTGIAGCAIGQVAFGEPDKAIICGGLVNPKDSDLERRSWWNLITDIPTFKWNRFVINPEDSLNRNYRRRTLSPFYSNGEQTLSDSTHAAIIFDVSRPQTLERHGQTLFNGERSINVSFDAFPEYVPEPDKYSITLTPNENIKTWWTNKGESGFTINVELSWVGIIDWKIVRVVEIPETEIDTMDEQETFEQFEDQ